MQAKTFDEIYQNIKNYLIAHQTKITDFSGGSVIMSANEAFSRVIESLYANAKMGFSSYMRGLPYSVFNFSAFPGKKASGQVVFSRSEAHNFVTVIGAGTAVSSGGREYTTVEDAVIPAGELDSSPAGISADDVGEDYNAGAGEIAVINGMVPPDVDTVTNPAPATGGSSKELWNDFIIRFNQYINGLQGTNENGIRSGIINGGMARSVGIVEHFPMLNGIYSATVYAENGSGGLTQDELDEIRLFIEGNGTPRYPSHRSVGLNFRYMAPAVRELEFDISLNLSEKKTIDISIELLILELKDILREYINNLKIGDNFYPADIITLFKQNPYILDAVITAPGAIILEHQDTILRYKDAVITYTMS